ncbi:MAG: protein-disulfide reductase DsbD domain-containing protein, partial [Pseudomonadota bacterium]
MPSFLTSRLRGVAAAALAALTMASGPALAVTSPDASRTERVAAFLHADHDVARPGDQVTLILEHQMRPGWHTYWRNPGTGGIPTTIEWRLPEGATAADIEWPAPDIFYLGPLANYGYGDQALLPSVVTIPEDWPVSKPFEIEAVGRWLACKDQCVPEEQTYRLTIFTADAPVIDADAARLAAQARAQRAVPIDAPARFAVADGRVRLSVDLPEFAHKAVEEIYFFPDSEYLLDHSAPQTVMRRDGAGVSIDVAALATEAPERVTGILRGFDRSGPAPVKLAFRIAAEPGEVRWAAAAAPAAAAGPGDAAAGGEGGGFWRSTLLGAALGAFLGGLILNLMPCVFPVLALKALALAKHAGPEAAPQRRVAGFAYVGGVLISFLVFAVALIGLKAGGAAVGWGFQLQSPAVLAAMAAVLTLVALNLSGVFEVSGRFAGLGAAQAERGGAAGSFFTGVLAAVVASPCTAPFMGVALGYALTRDAATALIVFAALGLGFAAPVAALHLSPGLARRLPRPGPWMVRFRQVMAFPIYLAAAWLLWVLAGVAGVDAMFGAMVALVLIAFAAWLLGQGYPESRLARRAAATGAALALIAAGAALQPSVSGGGPRGASATAESAGFAPERIDALLAEGRGVFVNVTADWCVSCKLNERLVLASDDFRDTLADAGAVYLEADWTRRDAAISAYLGRFQRVGVPL